MVDWGNLPPEDEGGFERHLQREARKLDTKFPDTVPWATPDWIEKELGLSSLGISRNTALVLAVGVFYGLIVLGIFLKNTIQDEFTHRAAKKEISCIEEKNEKCIKDTGSDQEKKDQCSDEYLMDGRILAYYVYEKTKHMKPITPWESKGGEAILTSRYHRLSGISFYEVGCPNHFDDWTYGPYLDKCVCDVQSRNVIHHAADVLAGEEVRFVKIELPNASSRCRDARKNGKSTMPYRDFLREKHPWVCAPPTRIHPWIKTEQEPIVDYNKITTFKAKKRSYCAIKQSQFPGFVCPPATWEKQYLNNHKNPPTKRVWAPATMEELLRGPPGQRIEQPSIKKPIYKPAKKRRIRSDF